MKTLDQSVFEGYESRFVWAAVDDDGICCLYEQQPFKDGGEWSADGVLCKVDEGFEPTYAALFRYSPVTPSINPPWVQVSGTPMAPMAPAFIPGTLPYLHDSIFEGFGSNWRWASIDYRGVARVHTFEPTFTANGRIEAPRFKANSEPREAFNVVSLSTVAPTVMKRSPCAPSFPTDRFGVQLPTGADPVEAADVVAAVPPPIQCATAPSDLPFMDYIVKYRLVGSRVTCNPPPLDTDQDVLCMVHQDNRQAMARSMKAEGFVAEGSWPSDIEAVASSSQVFESMRKGSMNYIVTSDEDFYKRFIAATELAKKFNIMTKAGRIELFQAVLYGNAP